VVGHRTGAGRVREITTACTRKGIEHLTLYALSAENYVRRPASEIDALMELLRQYTIDERPTLMENDIRFRMIGRLEELPAGVLEECRNTERLTAGNSGRALTIAVNYGGRAEITDAARALADETRAGTLNPDEIDEETVGRHMYTAGMPDVDLLIRTAGEHRISNFLLWQAWYAELYITDVLWPDFDEGELDKAIQDYTRRTRKFGAVVTDSEGHKG